MGAAPAGARLPAGAHRRRGRERPRGAPGHRPARQRLRRAGAGVGAAAEGGRSAAGQRRHLASRRSRARQPGPGVPERRAHALAALCRPSHLAGADVCRARRRADRVDRAAGPARRRRARQRARGRARGTGAVEASRSADRGLRRAHAPRLPAGHDRGPDARGRHRSRRGHHRPAGRAGASHRPGPRHVARPAGGHPDAAGADRHRPRRRGPDPVSARFRPGGGRTGGQDRVHVDGGDAPSRARRCVARRPPTRRSSSRCGTGCCGSPWPAAG